jgi:tRNA-dihydrouridine synthase C
MEGVMDFIFRDLVTSIGGMDQATTEFIRVTDRLLPDHVFYKYCPELNTASRTRSGVPVHVQLLGGQPDPLAENAQRLAELGALGIDLNFGCPAKTVNRHDGGASLLQYPERIHKIVATVRKSVPAHIPVTAKMRLGFASTDLVFENAKAIESGGACRLVVHARLKTDGYKPPAFWEWIPRIQSQVRIPVVANGEIWNFADLQSCERATGSSHFMIGRGVLKNPFLFLELTQQKKNTHWSEVTPLLLPFFESNSKRTSESFAVARTKQWLKLLSDRFPESLENFNQLKVILDPKVFHERLATTYGSATLSSRLPLTTQN